MSPQEASPPSCQTKVDAPEIDSTTDVRRRCSTTNATLSEGTRPSYREIVVIGGLFVAYVAALTAIGVFRAIKWPLKRIRAHQKK